MTRYINIEGYRKLFDEEYKETKKLIEQGETHLDNLAEGFHEASRVIDRIPTADVQVVRHAKWITIGKDITERVVCSNCYSHKGSYLKPPFCNQCGAKMDGKE